MLRSLQSFVACPASGVVDSPYLMIGTACPHFAAVS
jgi:Na+/serine symporter